MGIRMIAAMAALAMAAPAVAQTPFTQPPHQQGGWGAPEHGPDGHGGPGGPGGPPRPERMFEMMDANHDGMVSRSEFMAFHDRMREMRHGEHGPDRGEHGPGHDGPPPHDQ